MESLKLTNRLITEIKSQIQQARFRSMVVVNRELIGLYWNIGKTLSQNITGNHGKAIIETISKEIRSSFPGIKGFSPTNLWLIKQFFQSYKNSAKLQQLVAEIPWGQNLLIMQRIKDHYAREFYLTKCKTNGWSRGVLEEEIRFDAFSKSQKLQTNFSKTLPINKLAMYRAQFMDEYNLSFKREDTDRID